jgi:hypothetical protein
MGRITGRLIGAAGMLWLAAVGFAEPSGQPKQEPKKADAPAAKGDFALFVGGFALAQPNDAMIQQFEQNYGPQVRQMLRTELYFLRQVAQPTKPQYEKIAADGDAALKAAIPTYAEAMFGRTNNQTNPRTPITSALARSARVHLSAEQAERYQAELDQRVAAQKRCAVSSLVVMVDKVLLLSAEQRLQLEKVLESNWDNSWYEISVYATNGYYPPMPDAKIVPILTPAQQDVWRGIAKGNVRFGFTLGITQMVDVPDDAWDDTPPKPADGKRIVQDKAIPKAMDKQ